MNNDASFFTNGGFRRLIAWVLIGGIFLAFVHAIRAILPPFLIGALIGYLLDPVADRMERRGVPRTLATVLLLGLFFIVFIGACFTLIPLLLHQAEALVNALPRYLERIQDHYIGGIEAWLRRIDPDQANALKSAAANAAGDVVKLGGTALAGIKAVFSLLSLLLITPLVAFYLLRDWDRITARLDALLPMHHAAVIRARLKEIDATLAGFIHGQLTVCFTLAIYYSMLLTLVGLDFGFVIGMATGILVVLPYIGFTFGMLLALGVGFAQFGMTLPLAFVGAIFAFGQVLESYFLVPRLVGGRVGLHPLWIIFGMMAGGALFGFVGILLAIPVTAVAGVLIRYAVQRYLQSSLYRGPQSLTAIE